MPKARILITLAIAVQDAAATQEVDITKHCLSAGGKVTSGPLMIHGLIGSPFSGQLSRSGSVAITASWFPCDGGCAGDLNLDNRVDSADIGLLIAAWGTDGSIVDGSDLNGDGLVNAADLGLLIGAWGTCQ